MALAEESYTIFVHLIDPGNVPTDFAWTTRRWVAPCQPTFGFPNGFPGQRMTDPYRMQIPETLPPGTYFIEVGVYEMIGNRRLHISDIDGNLAGDRTILGAVTVE